MLGFHWQRSSIVHIAAALLLFVEVADSAADDAPKKSALQKTAAEKTAPGKTKSAKPAAKTTKKSISGYREQIADDAAELLKSKRTKAEQNRIDSMSWYMTGQLLQRRSKFKGALEAFEKAVALDPTAPGPYRALVPLAFSLKRIPDGLKYANKVIELDPDDFEMLVRLGRYHISVRDIPEGLKHFQQALKSKRLDHRTAEYVVLNRDLAIIYGATGKFDKAAECYAVLFSALTEKDKFDLEFRVYRQLLGDREATFERMGQAFLAAKKPEMAIKAFEEASKARQGRPGTLNYNLALVYFETKKYDKARAELQKYFDAELQSKGRAAYVLLAEILKATKKSSELIPALQKLAEKDARNHTLQFFLAEQLVEAKDLDAAQAIYERVLEAAKEPEALLGLVSVYRRLEKPDRMLDVLLRASGAITIPQLAKELEEIGKNEKLQKAVVKQSRGLNEDKIKELGAAGNYFIAKVAVSIESEKTAVKFFQAAVSARPRRQDALAVYQDFGGYLFELKDYKQAITVFQAAAKNADLVGQRPLFLFRLSYGYELSGQTEEALDSIKNAKQLAPDAALLFHQEGWVYYHSHQWEKAIKAYEETIKRFANDKEMVRRCQFSLSNTYVGKGDMKRGEEILEKVLDEDPDDPSVNNDLGYLYADQGKNLEKAEKMIRKAIKAEPENAAYLDSMGWVLYKLGKHAEAAVWLEKALKLPSGSDPTILEHLGDCYHELKRTEDARKQWRTALDDAKKEFRPDEKLIKRLTTKLGASPEKK